MKIIVISLVVLMFSMSLCYGAESDENVRVRIRTPRQHNEQAELDGSDNITIFDNSNTIPSQLFQLTSELSILMDSYYDKNYSFLEKNNSNNASIGPYHIRLKGKKYDTFDDTISEINNLKQNLESKFYPYYNGAEYEIYIGAYIDESSADNMYSVLNKSGLDGEVVNGNKKNIVVYNNENDIIFMYNNNSDIYFTSNNSDLSCNMIKIDNKPYRGMIAFNIINDSTLISINRVDIESYLYGVVPCESSASWPIEALKAQTLTARTYALAKLSPNAYYGYDLEDNTYDQVYGGYLSEYAATNKAVDETHGEVIYYDERLIDAVFHSTSGGSTENSENVWNDALPYLRGVEDEYSNISPITEWKETYSKEYLINRLKLYGNNVNDLYSIKITEVSENDRVLECIFSTDIGEIIYTKDKVRSVLGLKSLWFNIENNNSNNGNFYLINGNDSSNENNEVPSRGGVIDSITDKEVTVSEILKDKYIISSSKTSKSTQDSLTFISSTGVSIQNNNTSNSSEYCFNGRGWGHGVGMSQYGAKQMATEGFTYEEIIKHYYTGVNIK